MKPAPTSLSLAMQKTEVFQYPESMKAWREKQLEKMRRVDSSRPHGFVDLQEWNLINYGSNPPRAYMCIYLATHKKNQL
jgi:hypothetical protein